jgi:hypothetical protein
VRRFLFVLCLLNMREPYYPSRVRELDTELMTRLRTTVAQLNKQLGNLRQAGLVADFEANRDGDGVIGLTEPKVYRVFRDGSQIDKLDTRKKERTVP